MEECALGILQIISLNTITIESIQTQAIHISALQKAYMLVLSILYSIVYIKDHTLTLVFQLKVNTLVLETTFYRKQHSKSFFFLGGGIWTGGQALRLPLKKEDIRN